MKKLVTIIRLLLFVVVISPLQLSAQLFNVRSWSTTTTIENGIKITTNIPANSAHFPVVNIDGYNYGAAATIGLKIAWTGDGESFINQTVSSSGGYAPDIAIVKNEENKVVIFMDAKESSRIRFNITVFFSGSDAEDYGPEWSSGWTIEDAFVEARPIIYMNEFGGDVTIKGAINTPTASISNATIGSANVGGLQVNSNASVSGNLYANGRVGINTYSPAGDAVLDVNGKMYTRGTLHAKGPTYCITCLGGVDPTTTDVEINPSIAAEGYVFVTGKLAINETRTSRIGTNALAVNGTAIFTKAKVELNSTWPDYVFDNEYELRSLSSLETYLNTYKHLPDVPTADEVAKGGIDLGENQAVLLKKIEELTLYVIEQGKQQEKLMKKVEEQQKIISEQQKILGELKEQPKK